MSEISCPEQINQNNNSNNIDPSTTATPKTNDIRRIKKNLTVRSRERCLQRLRSVNLDKLIQFGKLHLSFLMDMDSNSSFEELFEDKQQQMLTPSSATSSTTSSASKNLITNLLTRKKTANSNGLTTTATVGATETCSEVSMDNERAIIQLVNMLMESKDLSQVGIFRKSGSLSRQKELRDKLMQSEMFSCTNEMFTIHDYATVLKGLLLDMEEPLLQERLIKAHVHSLTINDKEKRVKVVCILLQMMSSSHYKIAKAVFGLLHQVCSLASQNLMDASNLGSIFAPPMLCSRKVSAVELQSLASTAQSILMFIITNTPLLFQPPELLALDAANHIMKVKATLNASEDSIMSFESAQSSGSRSSRKHTLSLSDDQADEPIETVVTFTSRPSTHDTTQAALEDLYKHVQQLSDSSQQKQLYMKRFKEDKASQETSTEKRRSRTRSLGESIKRRLSKRRSKSIGRPAVGLSSSVIENVQAIKQDAVKSSTTMVKDQVLIDSLQKSPYALHRSSIKNLQQRAKSMDDIDMQRTPPKTAGEDVGEIQASTPISAQMPCIRKPLLSQNRLGGSDKAHFKKAKPSTQLVRYQLLSGSREYQATPPRPNKKMSIVDSNLVV